MAQKASSPLASRRPKERSYYTDVSVVGQEPFEWGFEAGLHYEWPHPCLWSLRDAVAYENSIEALMHAYKAHTYEIKSPYRVAPFERAFNLLMCGVSRKYNGDVIGTNLFRCTLQAADRKSRSPLRGTQQQMRQILDWQHGCLTEEIRLLNPTAIAFFTGPNYDGALQDEFPGLRLVAVDDHRDARAFARAIHNSLPQQSFRTYHPGCLVCNQERWSWVKEIATMMTQTNNESGRALYKRWI